MDLTAQAFGVLQQHGLGDYSPWKTTSNNTSMHKLHDICKGRFDQILLKIWSHKG